MYGANKFQTSEVENAIKQAKNDNKKVFTIKKDNYEETFYISEPEYTTIAYDESIDYIKKEYSVYYYFADALYSGVSRYLVKEKDGYYVKTVAPNAINVSDALILTKKDALQIKLDSKEIIYFYDEDEDNEELVTVERIQSQGKFVIDEVARGVLIVENDRIYLKYSDKYDDTIDYPNRKNVYGKSMLATFTSSFDDYSSTFYISKANLQLTLGVRDIVANDPQMFLMTANGIKTKSDNDDIDKRILPLGYKIPKIIKDIYYIKEDSNVVAYAIDDRKVPNYDNKNGAKVKGSASYEFYGDSNGDECHFVTSNGHVFTIPGLAMPQSDGTIQFYISNERRCSYVTKGTSNLNIGDVNINGDVVVANDPILYTDFTKADTDNNNAPAGLFGIDANGNAIENTKYTNPEIWSFED